MRVTILGAGGQLGGALRAAFKDDAVTPLGRTDADVTDLPGLTSALARAAPDLVINAAALVDVNAAERDPAAAFTANALGARWVAQAADDVGAGVVYISSDYVFPGDGGAPYHEWAPTGPLSVYGASKLAGERETAQHARRAWVVRTAWVFGGNGRTFVNAILRAAADGGEIDVVDDEVGSPTYAHDLAAAIRDLTRTGAPGLYHLVNAGECSRYELARAALALAGSPGRARPVSSDAFAAGRPQTARRPRHSTLANVAAARLGVELRPWRDALAESLCAPR